MLPLSFDKECRVAVVVFWPNATAAPFCLAAAPASHRRRNPRHQLRLRTSFPFFPLLAATSHASAGDEPRRPGLPLALLCRDRTAPVASLFNQIPVLRLIIGHCCLMASLFACRFTASGPRRRCLHAVIPASHARACGPRPRTVFRALTSCAAGPAVSFSIYSLFCYFL